VPEPVKKARRKRRLQPSGAFCQNRALEDRNDRAFCRRMKRRSWKIPGTFLPSFDKGRNHVDLNIKDETTHELVRRLAAVTGESLTEAVRVAVQERLRRVEANRGGQNLATAWTKLPAIALHCQYAGCARKTKFSVITRVGYPTKVIDTSAMLAILFNVPERRAFNEKIAGDAVRLMSAASF
jgi:hypothetical protein